MAARRAARISTKNSRKAEARPPARPAPLPAAREALRALRSRGRGAADHAASGGFGTSEERLGVRLPDIRSIGRGLARSSRDWPARDVVRLAHALIDTRVFEARLAAYELLIAHRAASPALTGPQVERLGRGNDNWAAVDAFSCGVAGPAWREGRVTDARAARWARSRNRWWRRTALASTVALNVRSRGGLGDVPRTLKMCARLVGDRDVMVVKALSWALRTAASHDAAAVRRFMERHGEAMAPLARREVGNKLATGRKNPPGGARA